MYNLSGLLKDAMRSIEETTVCFYQNKISEGYQRLDDTLVRLSNLMNEIALYREQGNEIEINEREIVTRLTEAMNALEQKDTLLLSDILEYEIKDILAKGYSSL